MKLATFTTGGDVSRFQRRTVPAPAPVAAAGGSVAPGGVPRTAAPAPRSTVTVTRGKAATTVTISRSGQVLETQAGAVQHGGQVVSGTLGMMP